MPAATATTRIRGALRTFHEYRAMAMPIGIVAVLGVLFLPLPPVLMDLLLSINIALSVVVLLTTVYVDKPLNFSVFPSLLLVTTLFRLVLNVATTRLILTRTGELVAMGGEPLAAAGKVIMVFGETVAGDQVVVGLVVFAIIIIIQFVVITKGATRISEVAARFTLDGMPGKQMAIDADLNSGLISEDEARDRRQEIGREADFYGAMDGASKFVRGDAIAGIIITLINIVGGLAIGVLEYHMDLAHAANTYTKLTIGDGLVSQVPAFIVSVAAGLLVTRAAASAALGEEFLGQLTGQPKAMMIAGGFLVLLTLTGLPAPILVPLGLMTAASGFMTGRTRRKQAVAEEEAKHEAREKPEPERVESLLRVDPMELEVGYGLIKLVDAGQGGQLLDRITMIRRQMAMELGLVIPPIRIRDNMQLEPNEYVIRIRGVRVARGEAYPEQFMAMDSGVTTGEITGIETVEPAFGLKAVWIRAAQRPEAESLGYTVVDATTVVATHLTEVIKTNAHDILNRQEVNRLIENVKETSPAVVEELIPNMLKASDVQHVLQNLLRERVSIRNLELILETLGDYAGRTKDADILTEYVRNALAGQICQANAEEDGTLYVVTMDPGLEETVQSSIEHTERGSFLTLSPKTAGDIVQAISGELEKLLAAGHPPVVVCSPTIRMHVRRLTENNLPQLVVLSYNEIVRNVKVETVGMVVLTNPVGVQ